MKRRQKAFEPTFLLRHAIFKGFIVKNMSLRKRAFGYRLTHLLVSELAEMLKNVALTSLAMALPISVFPVP